MSEPFTLPEEPSLEDVLAAAEPTPDDAAERPSRRKGKRGPDLTTVPAASADQTGSPDASQTAPAVAPLSQFQAGQTRIIHRSELKNAPYNPRVIHDDARRKLKAEIKRHGYLDRVVWNERTGHIVRGHQCLACLDTLERTQDYRLEVTVVDMDPQTEKETNISGNNTGLMGEYDIEALGKLFREDKVDFEAAGFDAAEIHAVFGSTVLEERAEEMAKMSEQLKALRERHEKMHEQIQDLNHTGFFAVVVFRDHASRKQFVEALGLPDSRYLDGRYLAARLGANVGGPDEEGVWAASTEAEEQPVPSPTSAPEVLNP